jgi:hypothetical protein
MVVALAPELETLSVHTEEWVKLLREVTCQKMKKSLQRKAFVVWEVFLVLTLALLLGGGVEKRH